MRRILVGAVVVYLLAAVITTLDEASGVGKQCGCEPDCWCKRPGLRLFRWVTPRRRHHLRTPEDKQRLAEANEVN
jgi:hypothetical protein